MTLESIERLRGVGEHLCWRVGGWHQHPEEFVNDLADAIEREIAERYEARIRELESLVRDMWLTWKRLDLEGEGSNRFHNGWRTFVERMADLGIECVIKEGVE